MASSKRIVGPLLGLVVVLGLAGTGLLSLVRSCSLGPWDGEARRLAAIVSLPEEFSEIQGAWTMGGILTAKAAGKSVQADHTFLYLPKDMQARQSDPKGIGTLVILVYGRDKVGSYSDGSQALQRHVDAWVVDVASGSIAGSRRFEGGAPPMTKSGGGDGLGTEVPAREIASWIESLPRR